jgi:uncharacterized protein YecE (DUF72 family)
MTIRIGTAGWSISRDAADAFPAEGTSLERYASKFRAAEINSSFHRPHRLSTWQRWRDSVPDDFRFAAKLPKTITHAAKLVDCSDLVTTFLGEAAGLGDKLAVLLVQLPPSLAFEAASTATLLRQLADQSAALVAIEPRQASWVSPEADALLVEYRAARVAADPARDPGLALPGGWPGLAYWRLHGSPVIYRSSYADRIPDYAAQIAGSHAPERWCIFDNTASSAATGDALSLVSDLENRSF